MILSYLGLSGKIIDVYGEESIDKRENPFNQVRWKMNIKQIQSFVAVADTKSFSEAAQSMYISVSQISKMVKRLEDELG